MRGDLTKQTCGGDLAGDTEFRRGQEASDRHGAPHQADAPPPWDGEVEAKLHYIAADLSSMAAMADPGSAQLLLELSRLTRSLANSWTEREPRVRRSVDGLPVEATRGEF